MFLRQALSFIIYSRGTSLDHPAFCARGYLHFLQIRPLDYILETLTKCHAGELERNETNIRKSPPPAALTLANSLRQSTAVIFLYHIFLKGVIILGEKAENISSTQKSHVNSLDKQEPYPLSTLNVYGSMQDLL